MGQTAAAPLASWLISVSVSAHRCGGCLSDWHPPLNPVGMVCNHYAWHNLSKMARSCAPPTATLSHQGSPTVACQKAVADKRWLTVCFSAASPPAPPPLQAEPIVLRANDGHHGELGLHLGRGISSIDTPPNPLSPIASKKPPKASKTKTADGPAVPR